jgi:DNA-directed RNA polymerase specialized sigma24 family protein
MRASEAPGLGSGPLGQETIERAELVRSLLGRVPDDVRQLAVNYYIDGMTQQEIADLHRISVPTVRKRLNQFVRRSRKVLTRELARALGAVLMAAHWIAT